MRAISKELTEEFCKFCDETFVHWISFCAMFPAGFSSQHVKSPAASRALQIVNVAWQEHYLHLVCKLHDPAVQQGQINLGIEYIIRYGGWEPPVKDELVKLQIKLDAFASYLRAARNKILSHNDLESILTGGALGGYPAGEDAKYFENLQAFVNVVHRNTIGGDFPFSVAAKADAEALHSLLKI
jgi:AbiU2